MNRARLLRAIPRTSAARPQAKPCMCHEKGRLLHPARGLHWGSWNFGELASFSTRGRAAAPRPGLLSGMISTSLFPQPNNGPILSWPFLLVQKSLRTISESLCSPWEEIRGARAVPRKARPLGTQRLRDHTSKLAQLSWKPFLGGV